MKEITFLTIGLCIGLYIGRLKATVSKAAPSCACPKP